MPTVIPEPPDPNRGPPPGGRPERQPPPPEPERVPVGDPMPDEEIRLPPDREPRRPKRTI